VAIAQLFPATVAEPPLTEQLFRSTAGVIAGVQRRLPGSEAAAPVVEATPQATVQATPLVLDETVQQQVEADLDQLEADLQVLRDRASQIETQLGILPSQEPLAVRLRSLRQRLDPEAEMAAIAPSPITVATGENRALRITLPSDLLFAADGESLRPSARAILDSVATDLQAYPDATIRVAGYPGDAAAAPPAEQRQQSFAQAQAIAQQLATRLGAGYTWLSLGYGPEPPTPATTATPPPNAHVEISIAPD
jgi:outer membrane protein OmpA-like peptidoglycan-associated protein